MKKVAVIMGSDSDWPVVKAACAQLKEFGIPYEAHILSAHRTPAAAAEFAKTAREKGFGVLICAAVLAAQILAVGDAELAARLDEARAKMAAQIAEKEAKLQAEL